MSTLSRLPLETRVAQSTPQELVRPRGRRAAGEVYTGAAPRGLQRVGPWGT